MKKVLAIVLTVCFMLALTACSSSPFTCDICGNEKTGKKHTTEALGVKTTVCDDCYKGISGLID